jgi:hypothetical protein
MFAGRYKAGFSYNTGKNRGYGTYFSLIINWGSLAYSVYLINELKWDMAMHQLYINLIAYQLGQRNI